MTADRAILHVDMDAFFASVEQLDDPELRGKPVLVGGSGRRGVVAAASYESRAFGCRSAMPTAVALRLCPHAVVVRGRFERYRELSDRVFEVLESFTPVVEPLSIDEAFLDVTGSVRLLGEPVEMARAIREKIKSETGLTASVGVAPNKFLAKFASDLDKPDGLTLLWSADVERVLWPRPITDIFGIGEASARKLHGLGVRTIGQIAAMPIETLRSALGDKTRDGQTGWADRLHERARGIDERPVVPDRHAKSVGHEQTFGENLGDPEAVRRFLLRQTEAVGRRLRAKGRAGRTVTVKIRFGDFETITRATTLDEATDRTDELWRAALATFDAWAASSFRPVRLVGVSVSGLTAASEPRQAGLFGAETDERSGRLDEAADAIAKKFGKDAITRARSLRRE